MEAIGYFRLPEETDETSPSVQEQEQSFFQFCQQQGFQPVATFFDPVESGKALQRGYGQLTDFLRQPGRGFCVVALSRVEELAAQPKDMVRRLLELEYLGAQLVFTEPPSQRQPLDYALVLWQHARSLDGRTVRAMDVLRGKAMRGYGLGRTPFGYRIGDQGRLEIVPEEASVVGQVYAMYVEEDLGLRLIARRLNDAATSTRRGLRWSVVTVRDILRNRMYTGTYSRFGVRVPRSHEAIIDLELFRKAQQKREGSSHARTPKRRTAFALTGLAYCGSCQGRMIGVSRQQSWARKRDGGRTETEYRYYRCGSRVNQSVCSYHTRRASALEQAVLTQMLGDCMSPPPNDPGSVTLHPMQVLKARQKALTGRLDRYLDNAAKGLLSSAELRAIASPVLREIQQTEERVRRLERSGDTITPYLAIWEQRREQVQSLCDHWAVLNPAERRAALKDLLSRVTVLDDSIEIAFEN